MPRGRRSEKTEAAARTLAAAAEFLRKHVPPTGIVDASPLLEEAKRAGIRPYTLARARQSQGIRTRLRGVHARLPDERKVRAEWSREPFPKPDQKTALALAVERIPASTSYALLGKGGEVLAEQPAIERAVSLGRRTPEAVACVGLPSGIVLAMLNAAAIRPALGAAAVRAWKGATQSPAPEAPPVETPSAERRAPAPDAASRPRAPRVRPAPLAVDLFIRETLAQGELAASDLIRRAEERGFTRNQLSKARQRLGAEVVVTLGNRSSWRLHTTPPKPEEPKPEPREPRKQSRTAGAAIVTFVRRELAARGGRMSTRELHARAAAEGHPWHRLKLAARYMRGEVHVTHAGSHSVWSLLSDAEPQAASGAA